MKKYIKERFNNILVQIILLVLIILAMAEFLSVSFLIHGLLKKVNIDSNMKYVRLFLLKFIILNLSMVVLFILIVLLVRKVFKKINNYAFYSTITGLPNKNYMWNRLISELSKNKKMVALISLDMDDFKAVNDTLGHLSGDELLRQAGQRFLKVIEPCDCVCHIGGDEFLFFIKSVSEKEEIEEIAKKIIQIFSQPFFINGNKVDYVTASVGISLMPQDGTEFETLYHCSDDAMYFAKRSGKNRYKFYDKSMNMNLYEEFVKKKEMINGMANREFKVFYQPKFSNDGNFIGGEALARWVREDGTIIMPSQFIDFAEKNGLIVSFTNYIFEEVCRDIKKWIAMGYKDFTISINITSQHIVNEKLCRQMIKKINLYQIDYKQIEFEITESMVIEDFNAAVSNIIMLKEYGIQVSMDDFGTGYSSLNYLKKLPLDIIKIDKSFIDMVNKSDMDKELLENIIKIAHGFQFGVIAEGVEDSEQYEILKAMRCDMFQGYYFGKPANKREFETRFLNQV